jgi:group I intron endonuclease
MINKPCIYCIENTIDNKKYIGQTVNPSARKRQHFWALKKGCHCNSYMQNAYNKYGKKSFLFKILMYCEPFELSRYEQAVVDSLPSDSIYNLCLECVDSPKGEDNPKAKLTHADVNTIRRDKVHTKKELSIIFGVSESTIGDVRYGRTWQNSEYVPVGFVHDYSGKNNPMYGKRHSDETREKISKKASENNLGRVHSEQTKALMSKRAFEKNYMRGRKLSLEERKRLSEITKGENSGNAKLTKVQVDEIRKIRKNYTLKELSKMFNVSDSTISAICLNIIWREPINNQSCGKKEEE